MIEKILSEFKDAGNEIKRLIIDAFSIISFNDEEKANKLFDKLILYKNLFNNFRK